MDTLQNLSILEGLPYPVSENVRLHQLFENKHRNKDHNSQKVAVIFEDPITGQIRSLTYAELEIKANKLARTITKYADKDSNSDGDFVVAVCMAPSDKLIVTLLAIWKTGAAYLPLDVNAPSSRIQHVLTEASPVLLITEHNKNENTDSSDRTRIVNHHSLELESSLQSGLPLQPPETFPSKSHRPIAIILYTSGSTGTSKGVRLPHQVVMNRLSWQWRTFPFASTETVCVFKTALTFVDAVSEIWAPLLYSEGRTLLVIPKETTVNTELLIQTLQRYKVERLVLVPTLLHSILLYLNSSKNRLLTTSGVLLQNLKVWICSGEPLPVSLAKQFLNYFHDGGHHVLCNFYGSTEIMGDVSYYVINSEHSLCFGDKVPIGMPIDNTALYLLDSNLQPVEVEEIGELYVSGYNLAAGYVAGRDPDRFVTNHLTTDPDSATLYRTGDFAKIEKNVLLYEGRLDSQIKVRGHRVDMSEVQAVLNRFTSKIDKSTVVCYKSGHIEQAMLAYVKLHNNVEILTSDIEANLRLHLPSYAVPQVIILDDIPLLNNGKVDRQTLLKLYERNKGGIDRDRIIDYSDVHPNRLVTAKYLFETVADVLGNSVRSYISTKANFYEIGGNSLNCIMTITKLQEKGYHVGINEFIKAPTLGAILDCLYFKTSDDEEDDIKENIPSIRTNNKKNSTGDHKYSCEMLADKHRHHVSRIITDSFYEKADLEQWLKPKPQKQTYVQLIDAMWKPLVEKNLSFIVFDNELRKYVAVSLNFDAHDEPEVTINNNLVVIFEFLEFLEGSIRDNQLPIGKRQILHSFMMGTDAELNAAENVQVIIYMEEENLRLARRKGFAGIFTTNTSPLTQQLGNDIFKYEILKTYQVNQYVAADGSMPFKEAPNEQITVCSWKQVT